MKGKLSTDARILFGASLAAILIIVAGSFFAPVRVDTDQTPSTYNSGSAGAKASYLLLAQLGHRTRRLEESATALDSIDAAHTTLILAEAEGLDYRKEVPPIAAFLRRGGHVLAIGDTSAMMLPDAHIGPPSRIYTALCYTTPQGLSPLARAGRVATDVPVRWKSQDVNARIDQACGDDAVVVHYPVGSGEVIWWSSSLPLSNRGLKNDPGLKLLLASVGAPGSLIVFDEYIHGARQSLWATASGTPVFAMAWQLAAVAVLLVLSFGRRNGPLRTLISVPRTSPLEFATSMGDLYRKAGAVDVAAGCAERRLMHFLEFRGGIPRSTLRSDPQTIASTVSERFRYRASGFADDLKAAREAETGKLNAKSALGLVQRLDQHVINLTDLMKHSQSKRNVDADTQKPHGETLD